MNIGEVERHSGLPARTIRYYDKIGLVRPKRQVNSYRSFGEQDIHKLRFLQRARSLGFSVSDCRTLLSLYDDKSRASADVKAIALGYLNRIDGKIGELRSLRNDLSAWLKPSVEIIGMRAGERQRAMGK